MKSIIKLYILGTLLFFGTFTSCTSDDPDKVAPVITIYEPSSGDIFNESTDSVHLEFHVADNIEIHEVLGTVTDSLGNILWQEGEDVDKKDFQFHDHYLPTGFTKVSQLKFKVTASDHSENTSSKEVVFYVKP